MASLQIIQNLIDQIPALLQEVADLRPANTGTPVWQEPSYSVEDIQTLEAHLTNWASTTEATLKEELGREPAQTFRQTWNTRHRDLPYKKSLQQKLLDSRKHLQTLLAAHQEILQAQSALTDIWALIHPAIEDAARRLFESKDYNSAIQTAAKVVKADIEPPYSREDALRKLIAVSIPMCQAEN
jgi:predicted esterase YcpF (UPF0227 family)